MQAQLQFTVIRMVKFQNYGSCGRICEIILYELSFDPRAALTGKSFGYISDKVSLFYVS